MYQNGHLDEVARVFVSAFSAPPLNYGFVNTESAKKYILEITRTPGFLGYVFIEQGSICAFSLGAVDNNFKGAMYQLKEFAVDAKLHRSGVGSEAMRLLEGKMAGLGIDAISLSTSRRLPAFSFYKKNGYIEIEENVSLVKWVSEDRKEMVE